MRLNRLIKLARSFKGWYEDGRIFFPTSKLKADFIVAASRMELLNI